VHELTGLGRHQFRTANLHADGHPWILRIPTVDVPLLRAAIIHANSAASG
jgi:hypothetical protein